MPWLKGGDNAATYPKIMQIAGFKGVDPDVIVNEAFGWLTRCMLQCAGHMTDYHVDVGTARMLGGRRTDALVALCKRAGVLWEVRLDKIKMFRVIDDPEFMHMRLRAEIEAERQRQRDNDDPALGVPVTLRDGDNCRYCGVLVQWRGRTSNRIRTLDHREGLDEPATADTLVVACLSCNSGRQLSPQWDDDHPLRPPPAVPLYGRWATKLLNENGHPEVQQNVGTRERPAPASGADPAPRQGVRPATTPGDDTAQPHAEVSSEVTSKSLPSPIETTSLGSGRDGTARVGSGQGGVGPGPGGAGPGRQVPSRRRRGRRGGRRRSRGEG